jgi:hypothetical protein
MEKKIWGYGASEDAPYPQFTPSSGDSQRTLCDFIIRVAKKYIKLYNLAYLSYPESIQ